jgi:hypothetical protein
VAVYLAFSQDFCRMERLGIRVSDDGFTRLDDHAKPAVHYLKINKSA